MSELMAVKALSGFNYIRADMVVAVAAAESSKCSVYLMGGITIHCAESAKDIVDRLAAITAQAAAGAQEETK